MEIKPIHTERDYQKAMKRIDELIAIDPKYGTDEFDELDIISTLVEEYEDEHYPIEPLNPIEAIKYEMEENGLTRNDIAKYLGNKSKVSEVLNGKRPLSLNMIKALHKGLGIPYDTLID